MTNIIERGAVTTGLVDALRTLGFPVGDNNSPTDQAGVPVPFGWSGEPDAAGTSFTPWVSLTPMPGAGEGQTLETLGGQAFWVLNYSVFVAGVDRKQSEALADRARNLLCNLGSNGELVFTGPTADWVLDGVQCTNIGSNQRNGEAIPFYYTQTDSYRVWATEGT